MWSATAPDRHSAVARLSTLSLSLLTPRDPTPLASLHHAMCDAVPTTDAAPPPSGEGGGGGGVGEAPGVKLEETLNSPARAPGPLEDTSGGDTANTTEAGEPGGVPDHDQVRGFGGEEARVGPCSTNSLGRGATPFSMLVLPSLSQQPDDADADPAPPHPPTGKIFIGGLPPTASTPGLRAYALPWGVLADAVVMEGRGFGFVTFEETACAAAFLAVSVEGLGGESGRGGRDQASAHPGRE